MKRVCALTLTAALCVSGAACSDDNGVKPPPDQIGFEQLVNACIISSACEVKTYPRISDCVAAYYNLALRFGLGPVYDQIFGCLAEAKGNCYDAFACYGSHPSAGTCDTTYTAKCDGDKALTCDTLAGKVFTFDCASADLSCRTRAGGSFEADCTEGACTSGDRRCDGARLLSCKGDGNLELDDCSIRGLLCAESPLTKALECTGETDKDCDIPPDKHQPVCEGATAVTCVNNRIHREDCSKRLFNKACKGGACAPVGTACSADAFNECQGSKLRYCLDGSWHTVDCAGLGLGPCAKRTTGIGADCTSK